MHQQKLSQSLQQKLTPQQIQVIKLLQVPTAQLDQRIKDELEDNPALEEGHDNASSESDDIDNNQEELIQDDILDPEDTYYFVRKYKLGLFFPIHHMVSLQEALAYGRLAGLKAKDVVAEHRIGRLAV